MKKLLILAVLLLAPVAYAADKYACCNYQERPLHGLYTNLSRVEFFGGIVLPDGDWKETNQTLELGETGFSAGIAFVRNVVPMFTIGLDGNYAGFTRGKEITVGGQKVNYRTGVATGLVAGRLYLFPRSMTRLYATGGIGAGYMYAREKNVTTKATKTYDSTDLAWMLGVGMEFDIDETVVFGAEGRYNRVGLRSDLKERFNHENFDYWTILLKLGIKF